MDTTAIKDFTYMSNGIHGLAAATISGDSIKADAIEKVAKAVDKTSKSIKKGAKIIGGSIDDFSETFHEDLSQMSSNQETRSLMERYHTVTQAVLDLKRQFPSLNISINNLPLLKMREEYLLPCSYIFSDSRNLDLFELFKSECRADMNPEGFLIRYLCHAETFHTHAEVDQMHKYFIFDGVWMDYNNIRLYLTSEYMPFLIDTGYPAGVRVEGNYFGIREHCLNKRAVPMQDEEQIQIASYLKLQAGDLTYIEGEDNILSFFTIENMRRITTAFEKLYAEAVVQAIH